MLHAKSTPVLVVALLASLVFAGCGGGGDGGDNGPVQPQERTISGNLGSATNTGEAVTGQVTLMLGGQRALQDDEEPLDEYYSDDGYYELTTDREGEFLIVVEPDGDFGRVEVEVGVTGQVEEVTIDVRLLPSDTATPDFEVLPRGPLSFAYGDEQMFRISIEGFSPTWTSTGGIGTITSDGLFTAGQVDATGNVVATLGDAAARVAVTVEGTELETPSADVNDALAVPMPTASAAAATDTLDRLTAWESDADSRPETDAELREELGWWVQAASNAPNDPAAQLGLSLSMLAVAGQDGAGALGYDLFEELDIQTATTLAFDEDLAVDELAGDAMDVASLSGVPRIRGAGAPQMDAADTTPGELEDHRQAVRNYIVPAVKNAAERCAAIGDASCGSGVALLEYEVEGETYAMYGADFQALAAGMQLMRCGLLMVTAVNPDYGDYEWDADLEDRDNGDGVLTPGEYAPGAPFGDINAADWVDAGEAIRDAVERLGTAISDGCLPADPNDLVRRALAEQQDTTTAELRDYFADALAMLSGEVDVEVEYARWQEEVPTAARVRPAEWVDEGISQIPVNLRELWDNPPNSFRALLPTLYQMMDNGWYTNAANEEQFEIWNDGWDGNNIDYLFWPLMEAGDTVSMPIGTGTHTVTIPAGMNDMDSDITMVFAADWSSVDVTMEGDTVTFQRDTDDDDWYSPFTWVPRWDELPTELKTFMGVFPDPDQIRDLALQDYDSWTYRYGHFEIEDEPEPWELY